MQLKAEVGTKYRNSLLEWNGSIGKILALEMQAKKILQKHCLCGNVKN